MKISPLLPVLCLIILPLDTFAVKPSFPGFSGLKDVLFGSSSGSSGSSSPRLRSEYAAESSASDAFRLPQTHQPLLELHPQAAGERQQGGIPVMWEQRLIFLEFREQNYIAKLVQPERAISLSKSVELTEQALLASLRSMPDDEIRDQEMSIKKDASSFLVAYDQAWRAYPDSLLVRSPALFRIGGLLDAADETFAVLITDVHWNYRRQMLEDALEFFRQSRTELQQKIEDLQLMFKSELIHKQVIEQQLMDIERLVGRHNKMGKIAARKFKRPDIMDLKVKLDRKAVFSR